MVGLLALAHDRTCETELADTTVTGLRGKHSIGDPAVENSAMV